MMKRIRSQLAFCFALTLLLGSARVAVGVSVLPITNRPHNDRCDQAESVGEVAGLYFDTTNATFDGPGLCMTSPNIWYCYTASCTGNVTVSLLGSSFDTMLAVYDGCGCAPTSNDLIECNDDFTDYQSQDSFSVEVGNEYVIEVGGNDDFTGYQSQVTFFATTGRQYLIEVGGFGSESGQGVLNISCDGWWWPGESWPSNDDCYDADSIGDVTDLDFSTGGATFDGPGLCMTSPNIWYRYTASCTGDVTISLAGSSFDTKLAVYDGWDCDPTQDDLIDCNDDSGYDTTSELTFAAIAGRRYLIEIGGYETETGPGLLDISCGGPVTPGIADLGDAPDSTNNFTIGMTAYSSPASVQANYPTVFNDGSAVGPYGPVHLNSLAVAYLGEATTRETEADTGADDDDLNNIRPSADSPDNDRGDDGVVLPLNLPNCGWGTIDYTVTVVSPGTDLWVNVWLDFNRDGDWDDIIACPRGPAREWAVQNQYLYDLPAGVNHITTPAFLSAHPKGGQKKIWMRITLSEQPWKGGSNPGEKGNGGSGPQAGYRIGETEDYYVTPETADKAGCPLCKDFNGDGVIDIDDLAAFTAEWLANCP